MRRQGARFRNLDTTFKGGDQTLGIKLSNFFFCRKDQTFPKVRKFDPGIKLSLNEESRVSEFKFDPPWLKV